MDLCLYISDQHSYEMQGYAGNGLVRTPNLDRIAASGTAFMNAVTPYPVCVPARMCMLSGLHSSTIEVYTNNTAMDSNIPTFLHGLNIAGYETVLCGRMHFVGADQRHGFSKRIAGDITQVFHNRPERIAFERGVHDRTPQNAPNSLKYMGGGNSPTQEYDRYVVNSALDYLRGSYERPQFISVGTYGPHHPFVAPKELYEYYYDKVTIPEETLALTEHPALRNTFRDTSPEVIRAARAAYYGMVEFEDQLIGRVYDAFMEYLKRNGREGIFVYVSDHGEHAGNRGYYGKNTFYDCSVHVPMIFNGTGIRAGQRKQGAVSLLDLGATFIDLAGSVSLPRQDGRSLKKELQSAEDDTERIVLSEMGGNYLLQEFTYGQMGKKGQYKFMHFDGYDDSDALYDLENDPVEKNNIIDKHPEIADEIRKEITLRLTRPVSEIRRRAELDRINSEYLLKCDYDSEELWHCTPEARDLPDPLVEGRKTMQDWLNEIRKDGQQE
ncbi:MAG: sulfatase-like hydrolase/transferase [Erysipelotrichaceae bacterium]|nr:sulfatase-like hydrolase/transferase [Erysipelotrichaceae bacterium]